MEYNSCRLCCSYDISLVDGYNVGARIQPKGGTKVSNSLPGGAKYNCGPAACGTPARPFLMSACPRELITSNGKACTSVCQAVVHRKTKDPSFVSGFDRNLVCCECGCGPECGCNDGKNPQCRYGCSPDHPTKAPFNYNWMGVCHASKWPKSSLGISYPSVFKQQCPDAYSWQFDDQASTYQCSGFANYKVTFY